MVAPQIRKPSRRIPLHLVCYKSRTPPFLDGTTFHPCSRGTTSEQVRWPPELWWPGGRDRRTGPLVRQWCDAVHVNHDVTPLLRDAYPTRQHSISRSTVSRRERTSTPASSKPSGIHAILALQLQQPTCSFKPDPPWRSIWIQQILKA